jgi:hypothetical protein
MVVTLSGMIRVFKEVHKLQKYCGMLVRPLGSVRVVNLEQDLKAESPKLMTVLGMLIVTKEEQP